MQDLLKLIVKYSNLLVLLILEVVAFILLVVHNDYPHATAVSTANEMAAMQYEAESNVTNYFALSSRNEELCRENADLREKLNLLEQLIDDSATIQAAHQVAQHAANYGRGYRYIPAKVIQMERRMSHNYLTINRGSRSGIRPGMGVRNSDGVVGIVCTVGENYSVVIPIIHTRSKISTMIAHNEYMGTLVWPGHSDHYARLEDVAIHVDVQPGDTLVSSGLTSAFPRGIPVGIVEKSEIKEGDSYYTIQVRLATNFRSLSFVQVIDNRSEQELKRLMNGLD